MSTINLHVIALGSTNPAKIGAVHTALSTRWPGVRIISVSGESGVPDQPWGDAETRRGALNRARLALNNTPEASLGIGLEGGLIDTEFGVLANAWCAVVDRAGRVGIGGGVGFMLPPAVERMVRDGWELGPAMDALTGITESKTQMGAVGILTDGLIDRQEAYAHTVKLAMARFVSSYFD